MPELPEVEVVRRGLAEHLTGAVFTGTTVLHPRAVRGQPGGAAALEQGLENALVVALHRRGKYLWAELGRPGHTRCLLVHLGMSGQMLLGAPGQVTSPHLRIRSRLVTADGSVLELSFVDQRTFGRWELTGYGVTDPVPHIADDPLTPGFDTPADPDPPFRDQAGAAGPDRGLRDREHLRRRGPVVGADPPAPAGVRNAAT